VRLTQRFQLRKHLLVHGLEFFLKIRERRRQVDANDIGCAHAALGGVEGAVQPRKSVDPRLVFVFDTLVLCLDASDVDVEASGNDFQLALVRLKLHPLLGHGFERKVGELDFDLSEEVVLAEERNVVVEEVNCQHDRWLADLEPKSFVPLRAVCQVEVRDSSALQPLVC